MVKRAFALGALLLLVLLTPALDLRATSASHNETHSHAGTQPAFAATLNSPSRQTGGAKFLTLPFTDPNIVVQQGWIYDWGSEHRGIDFVLGGRDTGRWHSYDVVASADGEACGNCTSRQGNAVWIKHNINGQTYYTYYGHLDSIESYIPLGSQQNTVRVARGQKIGVAGSTGSDSIHLHMQVNFGHAAVDPYDIWTTKAPYFPGCANCQMGENHLWTTNPPSLPSGQVPPPPPPPPAQATPTPAPPRPTATATPTPKPVCTINYGQVVEGSLSRGAEEVKYCLTITPGDWLSIRMFSPKGSSLDTVVKLLAPDGKVLAVDDDGAQVDGNSFIVARLAQPGTYGIVATRYGGWGQYRLRVDRGPKGALGDLNNDCAINQTDVALMQTALTTNDPSADLNLDGKVNNDDLTIQSYRLGRAACR